MTISSIRPAPTPEEWEMKLRAERENVPASREHATRSMSFNFEGWSPLVGIADRILKERKCGDDIALSSNNCGDPFRCPCCPNFTLNENYEMSVQHLREHGYVEKPDNPNKAAVVMPGFPLAEEVWFTRSARSG